MKSGGNDFNYFKLIKVVSFLQIKRMLMFCLEDWGPGPPLATPLYKEDGTQISRPRKNIHCTTFFITTFLL